MFVFQKANQFVNIIFCEFQSVTKKKCYTANAVSLLENRHFRSHRPHVFVASFKIVTIKKNATLQTLFPYWKIAIFGRIAPRIRRIVPS